MGVEVKGAGDGVVIADRGWNVAAVISRTVNRKSSASSRTLPKTRRLLALTGWLMLKETRTSLAG